MRDLIHTVHERYQRGMNPGRAFSLVYHQNSGIGVQPSEESGLMIMDLLRPHLGRLEKGLRSSLSALQAQQAAGQVKQLRGSLERDLTTVRTQARRSNERQGRAYKEFTQLVARRIGSSEESLQQLRKLVDERFAELAQAELVEERAQELLSPESKPITQRAAKRIIQENIRTSRQEVAAEMRRRERRSADRVLMQLQSDASYERLRSRA
jgi:hypothetical protein